MIDVDKLAELHHAQCEKKKDGQYDDRLEHRNTSAKAACAVSPAAIRPRNSPFRWDFSAGLHKTCLDALTHVALPGELMALGAARQITLPPAISLSFGLRCRQKLVHHGLPLGAAPGAQDVCGLLTQTWIRITKEEPQLC